MFDKINDTVKFLKSEIEVTPTVGLILGSGLNSLVKCIQANDVINYDIIPHFPEATVDGHAGKLVFGRLAGKQVVALQGRFHYYEGHSMADVTYPVRVMRQIGVKTLLVCNAAGGLNPEFSVGDLMLINDHINFFPENPLRGPNYKKLGPRFPDMSKVYDRDLLAIARAIGDEEGLNLKEGVYIGSSGPTLETPAEYRMMRLLGADATGMSTVPEVIVARHMNIACFGVSVITNVSEPADPDAITTHEEVLENAQAVSDKLITLFTKLIDTL